LLAEHFGRRMAVELDWPNWPGFSSRAMAEMETYPWPGNVRELRNVVERAVYRAEDPERPIDSMQFDPFMSPWAPAKGEVVHVEPIDRPSQPHGEAPAEAAAPPAAASTSTDDFRGAVAAYERALLEEALSSNRFNQRATAAALGLSYDQLRHALKRHKLLDAAAG
jgi:psp operon transcriptional activator